MFKSLKNIYFITLNLINEQYEFLKQYKLLDMSSKVNNHHITWLDKSKVPTSYN